MNSITCTSYIVGTEGRKEHLECPLKVNACIFSMDNRISNKLLAVFPRYMYTLRKKQQFDSPSKTQAALLAEAVICSLSYTNLHWIESPSSCPQYVAKQ